MLAAGRRFPDRVWAVEGCAGIGRHIAQRLVADGETVLDVPAKLSARVRVFDTGQGRKTDPVDAHSVAVAGLRSPGLRQVRSPTTPRSRCGCWSTAATNWAGPAPRSSAASTTCCSSSSPAGRRSSSPAARPATCYAPRPSRWASSAQTRHQLARELIDELTVIDAKIRAANKQLRQLVTATGSSLSELNGIGPSGAARLIGDIGDIARFRTAAHFASWNGTAPIEASSGDQQRHRLSRAGNRRINRVLHIMAIVQLRHDTPGRAYYRRRLAEGKTTMEALRALKRHLSDVVYKQMVHDANAPEPAGRVREDTRERLCNPARTAQSRRPPLRTSHSPDPPPASVEQNSPRPLDLEGNQKRMLSRIPLRSGVPVGGG